MFHVKHYSQISEFYQKNTCSVINNVSISSLIDLIYSDNNKKFILYDDKLYNQIIDNIFIERPDHQRTVGNIYKGKVQNPDLMHILLQLHPDGLKQLASRNP